jgi:hypothetical protein
MNHTEVLKKAWNMVWRYRVLWVFGLIIALTTTSWGMSYLYTFDDDDGEFEGIVVQRRDNETFSQALQRTIDEEIAQLDGDFQEAIEEIEVLLSRELRVKDARNLVSILIGIALTIVAGYVLAKIARYVAEPALIRMVDLYEETGERVRVRQGLRMGWSRAAWRFFLINLLVDVAAILAFTLLFGLAGTPFFLWFLGNVPIGVIGSIFGGAFVLLSIPVAIVAGAAISVLKRLARQACALDDLGVIASIRRGFSLIRRHVKDTGLMALIAIGIRTAWHFAMVPLVFILVGLGVILAGGVVVAVGGLSGLIWESAVPWIVAGVLGGFVFTITLVVPLAFLGGLREVFLSSAWTLTYRELRSAESSQRAPSPKLEGPTLKAAPAA